jgi:AcrR family transcriptional regulator
MPEQNRIGQGRRRGGAGPVVVDGGRIGTVVWEDRAVHSDEPGGPLRSEEQASSRDRILRAAEELFAEKGFDRTPTSRIAKEASVPQGLIFYHFPTKLDLLLALVRDYAGVFTAGLETPTHDRGHSEDAVRAGIEDLWADIQQRLNRYTRLRQIVFQELAAHPEIRQQAQVLQATGTSVVAARLARITGHSEPSPAHLVAGRLVVSAAVLGAVLHGGEDAGVDPHALAALLAPGLSAAPPGQP